MSSWPSELDAVIAATKHHRVLLENDQVRVLETIVEPGETVPMHTHIWPQTNYFIAWSHIVRRDENGAVTLDSRALERHPAPGEAGWSGPLGPHTLENVGDTRLHVITVESKSSAK